jgi:anaerobic magnesium-protoporphyrin IX monomethyl ester cyclase
MANNKNSSLIQPSVTIPIKPIRTSPWANAVRAKQGIENEVKYPNLDGMRVMILIPDDHYNKKLMSLGPGYVATAMQRCGIDVTITDCAIFSYDDIELAKIFIQSGVKIFGIGALYPMSKEVERLCGIIRAVVPGATIILGGALPTPIPEFILRQMGADIATIGESEMTIPPLMAALAGQGSLEDVRGIAYLRDGEFFHNGQPALPTRATRVEVGWPALDLYPIEKYIESPKFYPFEQHERLLPIVTGRGCPYACDFCYRVSAYRIRPFDDLLDEMEYMKDKYNLDGFYIVDDLLMLSTHKITDFCESVLERGLKIRYNCTGRVNTVTPKIIELLKESGCVSIYYGLESGNQQILQTMSKKTTLEQVHEAVRLTRDAGIYTAYGLMFGQPGENAQTLQDSVDLIKNISYGEYRTNKVFGCVPFPGSGLYDWCKEKGLIKDDQDFYDRYINQNWSLDQLPVNMTDLSDSEAERLFRAAHDELSQFFQEKMAVDWVNFFGGDAESLQQDKKNGASMPHIRQRVEADASTYDTSGRTS